MQTLVKRIIDIVVSAISLIVFSPLFLYCYLLVRRIDGAPVIFRQERIGKGGKPFDMFKFRTMRLDAEEEGPQLCKVEDEADDPRLTEAGRFLRSHHLDELPQLWNVFIGDMSFIGPRPERQYFIDKIMEKDPRYTLLYKIRPGVTSYATLYNGYCDTVDKMVRRLQYDLYYLEHGSLLFDAKILWLTFWNIARGKQF